jgi:uncharacterized protein with NRDE domain
VCLIVFAWKAHRAYPLVLAANRDEFLERPSLPLDYWDNLPNVLGGRDLEKGGSWFATHMDGRWAAVTNFRDGGAAPPSAPSRGHLVLDYVASDDPAKDYAERISGPLAEYPGCNLLLGDTDSLLFASNRWQGGHTVEFQAVSAGVHGLSNHSLDTPWPKVERSKRTMQRLLDTDGEKLVEELFVLLADRTPAREQELPATGVPHEWERTLSAPFIVAEHYGTRASTVVLVDNQRGVSVRERSFGSGGEELARRACSFKRGERRN